ncbi:MAG: phytanoyl-CoA dioxygenase [Chitinophagaceae bacterium]|nr:MAG: phytanoyl-CoA dioxygenase [Chitinophagaceae bacterium]
MNISKEIEERGFAVLPEIYSGEELALLSSVIETSRPDNELFRKTGDLFAIRQFFRVIPEAVPVLFNERLRNIILDNFGQGYFVVKSIYFDKPNESNWFVAYHQDLTISVKERHEVNGFGPWTVKKDQFAVQAPVELLADNFTIRVHLDTATAENGALKVVAGSHKKGVYRPETIDWKEETEDICEVKAGGIMIMRPLLLHSSGRTTNHQRRRVVHIEFSRQQLPEPLGWSGFERVQVDAELFLK